MERLRKKDEQAGIAPHVVTAAQKEAIAEIRNFYEAKLAELEVLRQGRLMSVFDPAQREVLDEGYRRDRERLNSERDAKLAKARSNQ